MVSLADFFVSFGLSSIALYNTFASQNSNIFDFIPVQLPIILALALGLFISGQMSVKFVSKVSFLYLFFLVSSYFIEMTLRLNDADFEWQDYKEFWQHNYLNWLGLVLLVALFFKLLSKKVTIFENIRVPHDKNFAIPILAQFLTSFYISSNQFLNRLEVNTFFPLHLEDSLESSRHLFLYAFVFYLLFLLVTITFIKGLRDIKRNTASLSLAFSSSVFLATLMNYSLQAGITEQGAHYGVLIAPGATIYQILVLSSLFFIAYIAINRYIIATLVITSLSGLFSLANSLKYTARHQPIVQADLMWLKDISFFKDYISLTSLVEALAGLAILVTIVFLSKKVVLPNPIIKQLKRQLVLLLILFSAWASFLHFLTKHANEPFPDNIPVLSPVYNLFDVDWLGINANTRFQSLSYVWIKGLTVDKMNQPKGYSKEKIKALYKKYQEEAYLLNSQRQKELSDQTVIFILSESLADPTRLNGITAANTPIPYIQALKESTTGGYMISDGYGGGTANMEFQTLTGLPFTNFNSNVSVLYSEVVPNMKKMPSISDFYKPKHRQVIHLNNAQNYNRLAVYKKLDFNKFIASSGTKDKPSSTELYGPYPSDKTTYQNVLTELNSDKGQFIYALTMQNHGPYGSPHKPYDIWGDNFSDAENNALQDYADRLLETDRVTEEFLNTLKTIDKEITVVFYGDHLPGLYPTNFFQTDDLKKQTTDYFIWSNKKM